MRISDWSSDVCSSDLAIGLGKRKRGPALLLRRRPEAFMIFAAGLEQQQIVLADPCLERAPRLGRDRLLPFVVQNRHRPDSSPSCFLSSSARYRKRQAF